MFPFAIASWPLSVVRLSTRNVWSMASPGVDHPCGSLSMFTEVSSLPQP